KYMPKKLHGLTPGLFEKLRELLQALPSQVPQEPAVHRQYRFIKSAQELKAGGRDAYQYDAAVLRVPPAFDQLPVFQAVEKARDVRIACNHTIADLAACQSLRCTAQDSQHVVLRG